jgi:hypothetical protein
MNVRIVKDRVGAVLKGVRDLTSKEVLVGIPSTTAGRTDTPINNAEIGYLMETGSPAQNIPERPFLVPGVESASKQFVPHLKAAGLSALEGKSEMIQRDFDRAGMVAANSVKAKITEGPFTPLSPKTLAKRRAKGRTGERPLIDTGQLRRSVTHVVRKKGS